GEPIDLWRLLQATFMSWLVGFVISLVGFAFTAIFGKRAVAGSIAGAFAFLMYVITALVVSVKSLRFIEHFSPFHYFNNPSPLKAAFDFGDMFVLLAASIVFIVLGYAFFRRRDVYQR
ncbi:MAG: ABC transporter permease subunit, partial [Patescibacteria group bacterium]